MLNLYVNMNQSNWITFDCRSVYTRIMIFITLSFRELKLLLVSLWVLPFVVRFLQSLSNGQPFYTQMAQPYADNIGNKERKKNYLWFVIHVEPPSIPFKNCTHTVRISGVHSFLSCRKSQKLPQLFVKLL